MEGSYLAEFMTIIVVHLLAVASPGPDFAIVVRQSVSYGRSTAIFTSIGVGTGILLHVVYSILGIGVVVSQSILAFTIMKFLGAAYLVYLGLKAIRTGPSSTQHFAKTDKELPSWKKAFWTGFFTNGLNPKATLFFLALFTVIISPQTPVWVQIGYGVYMAFATAIWFSGISLVFGNNKVRFLFSKAGHWFERLMGGALILLGIKLAVTSQK